MEGTFLNMTNKKGPATYDKKYLEDILKYIPTKYVTKTHALTCLNWPALGHHTYYTIKLVVRPFSSMPSMHGFKIDESHTAVEIYA